MRTINFFLWLLGSISIANAGIITVNNTSPSPGQYSDLQTAIDVASSGDTLLIQRSASSYGNVTITKRLVLIGEGALPNKIPQNTSTLGTITLTYNTTTLSSASKSKLIGLSIATISLIEKSTDVNYACDSVSILNCKITTLNLKNRVYDLNVSHSFITSVANGLLFNCRFSNNFLSNFNSLTTLGENNIFLNNLFFTRLTFRGGIIANNIFFNNTGTTFIFGCYNSIVSNNIFYSTSTTFNSSDYIINGNTSVNNQFNINPLFVNPVLFNTVNAYTHTSPASGPFADFHLQTGSPAIGAGTDGTDLGLYGGSTPWRDESTTDSRYRYYPLPDAVPVVTAVTVQNPVVQEGTNLQIQLGATTQP